MLKRYFIIVSLFLFNQVCISQNQISILFIGNSLTGFNDLPGIFKSLCNESNKDILVDHCYRYGKALRHYVNDETVINKIKERKWSYVVLQSDDISAFEDMYHIEINTLKKFKKYIQDNCSSSKIIYEMIWGLRNGVYIQGEGYYSYEDYINKIYEGTLYFSNELNLTIAPVGWAWRQCRQNMPDLELFTADNAHPAYPGSYLGACVFYNIIWGEEINNNSYYGSLFKNDAIALQSIANNIVINNLELWNYSGYIPTDIQTLQNSSNMKTYPNPFTKTIKFEFYLQNPSNVKLEIFTVDNKLFDTIINHKLSNGKHQLTWNINNGNKKVDPGLYFYRLTIDKSLVTGKIIHI